MCVYRRKDAAQTCHATIASFSSHHIVLEVECNALLDRDTANALAREGCVQVLALVRKRTESRAFFMSAF